MHHEQSVFYKPFIQLLGIKVMMDFSIVQNDQRHWQPIFELGDVVYQANNGLSINRLTM